MSWLYLREDLETATTGDTLSLVGAEARHAATVNRTRAGATVSIGNGRGLVATGTVIQSSASELTIDVERVEVTARATPRVTLVQALAKGDRDELAIQAATELGVDAVVPWAAERSVSRWEGLKVRKGQERWAAIVREAAKQSIRAWVPEVGDLASSSRLVQLAGDVRLVVLDPDASHALTALVPDERDLAFVVGPEGGISPGELERFRSAGAEVVHLGSTVLRTSTAGPAALAVLNAILGRW